MRSLALLIAIGCAAPEPEIPRTPAPGTADVLPDPFVDEVLMGAPRSIAIGVGATERVSLLDEPHVWVPALVVFDGLQMDAEIRLKGHGSFQPFDARPSLKVRFDHTFYGRRTLILNNGTSDITRTRERLASEAFRLAGLPVARAGNVWVELNNQHRGMYTVLEDVEPGVLRRLFGDGNGSLYEIYDGDFTAELVQGLEHEEGPEADAAIEHVVASLALGDVVGFDAACDVVHREAFLRFLAMTVAVAQTDAYPYSVPGDDVYLYVDPGTERMHFLPHGLDEAFEPRGLLLNGVNGMLARRCIANAGCRAELAVAFEEVFEVLDGPWSEEVLRVEGLAEDWVEDARWQGSPQILDLAEWPSTRRASIEEQLQEFADLR